MIRSLLALSLLSALGCGPPASSNPARLERIAEVYDSGDAASAVEQLNAYVKQYPQDDMAWTILANAHEDLDQNDDAQIAYDKALAINPRRFEAITGLGVLHRKRGEDDKALLAYQRAVEIDPNYAHAYSSMAVIALKRGQDEQALQWAKKGYDLDQSDGTIAANLAVAYHYSGDAENRDRMTQIAQRLGYSNIDTLKQIYSGELSIRD